MTSHKKSTVSSSPPPLSSTSSTSLMVRPPSGALTDDVRMQSLWLSLQQRSWRSLALVGASRGVGTLAAANNLAKIAWWYTGQPTAVFDMRDLSLRLLEHQLRDMASQAAGAERVFIALRSTDENPTAVPLARAADACVLCVQIGRTDARSAQKTLEAVGRSRFIGTILVSAEHPSGPPGPPAPDGAQRATSAASPAPSPPPPGPGGVHPGASARAPCAHDPRYGNGGNNGNYGNGSYGAPTPQGPYGGGYGGPSHGSSGPSAPSGSSPPANPATTPHAREGKART